MTVINDELATSCMLDPMGTFVVPLDVTQAQYSHDMSSYFTQDDCPIGDFHLLDE